MFCIFTNICSLIVIQEFLDILHAAMRGHERLKHHAFQMYLFFSNSSKCICPFCIKISFMFFCAYALYTQYALTSCLYSADVNHALRARVYLSNGKDGKYAVDGDPDKCVKLNRNGWVVVDLGKVVDVSAVHLWQSKRRNAKRKLYVI